MNEKPPEKPSLESLNQHLEALKQTQKQAPKPMPTGDAARWAIDFASATAVGFILGFGADQLLNSSPWGMVIGLLLGVFAGFRLLMKAALSTPANSETKNGQ